MLEGVTAFSNTKMKSPTSKQLQRMEKKKKKLAAFLEIAKLNDKDREAKAMMHRTREDSESTDVCDNNIDAALPREEPRRKRHKKDNDIPEEPKANLVKEETQLIPNSQVKSHELIHEAKPQVSPAFNTPSGKPPLAAEEYKELKRELCERRSRLKCLPRFLLKEMGENASINATEDDRTPLFLSDIQHLLMFSVMGLYSPYVPNRWCLLEKYNRLSHRVVLVVEGLSLYDFQSHESLFTNITDTFKSKVEVITPVSYGGNIIQELSAVPITSRMKDKLLDSYGTLEMAMRHRQDLFKVLRAIFPVLDPTETPKVPTGDKFPRTLLLLSASQLIEEQYPLPLKGKLSARYADFVLTKDLYHEVSPSSPMFALDCEMCRTTTGDLELTRISIVNEKLEVVYESLVKPYNRIVDYLTRFSGITKELLAEVTTRLEDVQRDIRALLPPDAILVGQSLNFDMMALKMMHPYVIDTSVIYNITGERGRKTKLALLSQKFLGEEIQQGDQGHCSVEDSASSMKLAQLKLANDIEFGDAVLCGYRAGARRGALQTVEPKDIAQSIFTHVATEKSVAVIGCPEVIDEYSKYMPASLLNDTEEKDKIVHSTMYSNEMVVSEACILSKEHGLTLAHLQVNKTENEMSVFNEINKWCGLIWDHMAYNGLCVILFSGEKNGANGASFIQIKRPPRVSHRTSLKETIA